MKTVCEIDMCMDCKACLDVCSKSAITLLDTMKSMNAAIDENLCVDCGACRKVCQQVNPALTREKREEKNLPICGDLCDNNDGSNHYFFAQGRKRGRFFT